MKLCIAPQSSEHWPEKEPNIEDEILVAEILPGIASSLRERFGRARAWMTSTEVRSKSSEVVVAIKTAEFVESAKRSPSESIVSKTMSEKSKVQYHWIPKISIEVAEKVCRNAPDKTKELSAKVPIVGIIKEIDSSLRELVCAEVNEDFVNDVFSKAAKIKKTDPKNPAVRTDQSADERVKTDWKVCTIEIEKMIESLEDKVREKNLRYYFFCKRWTKLEVERRKAVWVQSTKFEWIENIA